MLPLEAQNVTAVGGIVVPSSKPGANASMPTGRHRYEIRDEISRGGCGLILRAFDRQLEREVVIKRILPELATSPAIRERFLNEARVTGLLEHPGIVPIHEVGIDERDGAPFYVMKWLHGKTLADAMQQLHGVKQRKAKRKLLRSLLERFQKVCQTVAYAHEKHYVHRDLKPENILIGEYGETVVLDWGLAKRVANLDPQSAQNALPPGDSSELATSSEFQQSEKDSNLTIDGSVLGTASYMSPEQASGNSNQLGPGSDVFSLGVILYEIMTGISPFRGATTKETLERVVQCEFPTPRQCDRRIPRTIDAIIMRALQPKPEDRYPSARELELDIESYLSGDSVSAFAEPWWVYLDRLANNHRTLLWSTFLAMAAIVTIAMLSMASIHSAHRLERLARKEAESEHRAKAEALDQEKIAHLEAVTQLQAAREAVDGWLIDLSEELKRFPGLAPVRLQLLDRGSHHYQTLLSKPPSTSLMTLEKARASIRLGDLQFSQQDAERAYQYYQQALELLNSLSEETRPEWREIAKVQSALAHAGVCQSLLFNEQIQFQGRDIQQRAEEAGEHAEQAIKIADSVPDESPEFYAAQRALARSQRGLAHAWALQRKVNPAIGLLQQSISLVEWVRRKQNPLDATNGITGKENADCELLIALLSDLGKLSMEADQTQEALRTYLRSLQLQNERLENGKERADWLEARAMTRMQLGTCFAHAFRATEAITQLEAAEEDFRRVGSLLDASLQRHDQMATVRSHLGNAYLIAGEFERASDVLQSAMHSLEWMMQTGAACDALPERTSQTLLLLANAWEHLDPSKVPVNLDRITELLSKKARPEASSKGRNLLQLQSLVMRIQNYVSSNQFQEAIELFEKEQSRFDDPFHDPVENSHNELLRGSALSWMARAYQEMGMSEKGAACEQTAVSIFRKSSYSSNVSIATAAEFRLLEHLCHRKNVDPAEGKEAVAIAEKLVGEHANLAVARHWFAVAQWRSGDRSGAVDSITKAIRLRRNSAVEDALLLAILDRDHASESSVESPRNDKIDSLLSQSFRLGSHAAWLQTRLFESLEQRSKTLSPSP